MEVGGVIVCEGAEVAGLERKKSIKKIKTHTYYNTLGPNDAKMCRFSHLRGGGNILGPNKANMRRLGRLRGGDGWAASESGGIWPVMWDVVATAEKIK